MGKFWIGLLPLAAVFGAGAASAAAAPLTSHRAIYDISLDHATTKSPVAQVSGRLVIEWLDTCDGFTTNQRMYTRLDNAGGGEVASDLWLSSWESRDGQTFRFSMTTRTNGKIDEASRGTAKRGAAGAKGSVEFEVPRAEVRELPSATLFPTSQMVALLQAARAGKRLVSQTVFDGSAEEGLNDVSTFIGPKSTKAAAPALRGARELASGSSWPVRMAFFDPAGTDDFPDYEFAYRMFENGVSSELQFDYGEFVVKGTLKEIKALADAGCKDAKRP